MGVVLLDSVRIWCELTVPAMTPSLVVSVSVRIRGTLCLKAKADLSIS